MVIKMKILIAGDLVPTKSNEMMFQQSDFINNLDKDLVEQWNSVDLRMFNLECPLGERMHPIFKNGPNLLAPSKCIEGIASLNPSLVFLANNHIMDYGSEGLSNTLKLLKSKNIKYTGILNSLQAGADKCIINSKGIRLGVYNVCENEFSTATETKAGANPLNVMKNCNEISALKEECDLCLVIFHGGKEFYRYPSPNLQEICHGFVDYGADLVITQHSHCIGCEEKYKDSTIVYGQGNFIFDGGKDEFWNTALWILLEVKGKKYKVHYIPIEKKENLIKISESKNILVEFSKRSDAIQKSGFIQEEYKKFATKKLNEYLNIANKSRFYKKILNRLFKRKFFYKTYNAKDCIRILNAIECEAHRELFIAGLKEKIRLEKEEE